MNVNIYLKSLKCLKKVITVFLLLILLKISIGSPKHKSNRRSKLIPKDTITLVHIGYKTLWSSTFDYPLKVEWWGTKERIICNKIPRKDNFGPDPLLSKETDIQNQYDSLNKFQRKEKLKGIDRGHMLPAADNQCSLFINGEQIPADILQKECFYFTNIAPQYHSLNAGDWKKLEERTRELISIHDSIYVWCGSVGTQKVIADLHIPVKCWKVIYIKRLKIYECYIFSNTPDMPVGLGRCKVNKQEVEKLTGFKFNL